MENVEATGPVSTYRVNEIFLSLQGEGVRAGTLNVFVRFSGCNLQCAMEPGALSPGGFDCDTEFRSGRTMTAAEIAFQARELSSTCEWIILTGGEPALQVDDHLIAELHEAGFRLAIETNGSQALPTGLDWITCSPKVAEHALKVKACDELKYVRCHGQAIPRPHPFITADHYLISPAVGAEGLTKVNLDWCMQLVRDNPKWRLSIQLHKFWGVR